MLNATNRERWRVESVQLCSSVLLIDRPNFQTNCFKLEHHVGAIPNLDSTVDRRKRRCR